jgi:hypothetical protein
MQKGLRLPCTCVLIGGVKLGRGLGLYPEEANTGATESIQYIDAQSSMMI